MAYVVADRVKETSTSTGTGSFTLAGAVTGFRTFSSAIGNSNTTTYVITDATGSQWEIGLGTLSGGTTLARTSIFRNSSGGTTALNFSAGAKTVFVSMSAAPRNNNTSLGTDLGFSPNSRQFTTVIGYGASVLADYATAVGQYSTANGGNDVAVGGGTTASGGGATAVGQQANAAASNSVAVGVNALSGALGAVAIGWSSSANSDYSVVVGASSSATALPAPYDNTVVVGSTSSTTGGITIGSNSPGNVKYGATIIGHGVTPLQDDATYMNKFRTSVTPVGTQWFLKWDDSTKEVYADGATPPAGPNWYTYQTQTFPGGAFSLAMPSGMPTSSFGFLNQLFSTQNTFGSSPSPSGGWAYTGTSGNYNAIWVATTPQTDPTVYSGTSWGTIIVYYRGYETDAGAVSTVNVNTGTSLYSNISSSFYCSSFSVFGTTQYGHAIVSINGNYVGAVTASAGATFIEDFYDSSSGYTYAFFDLDSSGVSNVSVGLSIGIIPSSATYETIFWYNYS